MDTMLEDRNPEDALESLTRPSAASEIPIDAKTDENTANTRGKSRPETNAFDTGIRAWLQVLGAFFLWFNTWGIINTYGTFQTYYEQHMLSDMSPSTIAWVGSTQSALLMLVSVLTGPLFDAGYFSLLMPLGTFLLVFGFMMSSISTKYYQIMLAQGVCVGVGTGFLFMPAVALLPQYFKKKRSLANGIAATGSSIGGVLYPIMFHKLQREIGFPWATRALAFLALATCSLSISVMRLRFRPQQKRALIQLSAFKDLPYMLFCSACFAGFLGFYDFLIYIQPFAIETGIVDENVGFYLLPALNAASTFGRVICNYIADYTGPLDILIPALTATAALAYCWAAIKSTAGIITLSALYGFFSGGFASLVPVAIVDMSNSDHNVGARLGMCFAIESVGLLIGTPIGGAILSHNKSYLGVQMFCGSCLTLCALILVAIRLLQSGVGFCSKR